MIAQAVLPCPPAMMPPTVWAAPMPAPVVQAAAHEVVPAPPGGTSPLEWFMVLYGQACAAGDTAKSRMYAEKCLAIDPTCFGK
jgi:hypothetical protein